MEKGKSRLFLLLIFFIFVWAVTSMFQLTILWFVILGGLSIYYIIKNKNIEKMDVVMGCLFGVISMPSNFIMGIITIPTYIGAMSLFKKV